MKSSSPQFDHCLTALKRAPFFDSLSDEILRDILGLFRYETAQTLDTNLALDGGVRRFYLIVSGRVKVSAYNPETGREHILYLLGPGDGFDIVSLLDGEPHDVVATALDNIEVLATPLCHVRDWLFQHPDFNKKFLPYLGGQMRQLSTQIEDLSLYDTETRLARLVLRHLTSNSPVHGLSLINDLSQEALASMIGTARVVVAQHIRNWKDQGILAGGRGHWSVEDARKLLELAERQFDLDPD